MIKRYSHKGEAEYYDTEGEYIVSKETGRRFKTRRPDASEWGDYLDEKRAWKEQDPGFMADMPFAKNSWRNYNQWRFDARQKRDKATAQIRRNYGSQNQKLRDILVKETNRKYKTDLRGIERGATSQQLQRFFSAYGSGDPRTGKTAFLQNNLGAANVNRRNKKDAGEERARQAAGGRAPRGGTSRDATNEKRIEDEAYYGWG